MLAQARGENGKSKKSSQGPKCRAPVTGGTKASSINYKRGTLVFPGLAQEEYYVIAAERPPQKACAAQGRRAGPPPPVIVVAQRVVVSPYPPGQLAHGHYPALLPQPAPARPPALPNPLQLQRHRLRRAPSHTRPLIL